MAKIVMLEKNGLIEKGYVGFSWTTFFFGFFVPALRFDIENFFLLFFIEIITSIFYVFPYSSKLYNNLKAINLAKRNFFSEIAYKTKSFFGFAPTLEQLYREMVENLIGLIYGLLIIFLLSFLYALFYK